MFEPDAELGAKMAEAAETAARRERGLGRRLDFTRDSIAALEALAVALREVDDERAKREALQAYRDDYTAAMGAYLGETMRRNLGGEWGWAVSDGRRTAVLRTANGALIADPVAEVRKRLAAEQSEDFENYYYVAEHWAEIAAATGGGTTPADVAASTGFTVSGVDPAT